mgnify:CR=1 FL=1
MLIGKNYKIESDELNVTVYSRHLSKKTGKENWKAEGYFSTIKNALDFLIEVEVRKTGLADLLTIVKKQEELHTLIKGLSMKEGK